MPSSTDTEKIKTLLEKGVEEIVEKSSLESKLASGRKLRIKHGIDPTGPKIHIGRATQFWKLKAFQELGHQIVLIIGDFTAKIGDASDKDAMRRPLSEKEIKENMKGYASQIGRILDLKKVELRHNSEWLGKLSAADLLGLQMKFTAQQLIHRRNFKERWEAGKEIGLHELNYPLLQGYDSVAVKADVELGGSDQLFNLLAGREIQKSFGQKPQDVMTLKMLSGTDGRKMSTSWGNIIAILDEPADMYGKVMSMKDEQIPEYFELAARLPEKEVAEIARGLREKTLNPKDAKARLAFEIVSLYHGEAKARKAQDGFERVFRAGETPEDMEEVRVSDKEIPITELLVKTGLASSKSEAKRLVIQKGVKIDGETQSDWQKVIVVKSGIVIQAGKRRFVRIK